MTQPKKSGTGTKLSRKQQTDIDSQVLAQVAISHQGPLPLASEFAAYERVLPGSADRIIAMAEASLEAEISAAKIDQVGELISLISGRLFLYALLGVAVYLLVSGRPVGALLAGLAPIVSAIYGTIRQSDNKGQNKESE